jgi:hypothetical protein
LEKIKQKDLSKNEGTVKEKGNMELEVEGVKLM